MTEVVRTTRLKATDDAEARAEFNNLQRLETDFGRYRQEFQRTRDDVLHLNSEITNLKNSVQGDISDLKSAINGLAAKMDEKSKTNWPAIALAVSMVPAIWLFVTTYTANAISPTNAQTQLQSDVLKRDGEELASLASAAASSTASDVASRTDRIQLNDRLRTLEGQVASEVTERRSSAAATKVNLAEIESQFHALSNVENLRAAQQERLNSMMWEKSHPGERYPNGTFFPTSLFGGPASAPEP